MLKHEYVNNKLWLFYTDLKEYIGEEVNIIKSDYIKSIYSNKYRVFIRCVEAELLISLLCSDESLELNEPELIEWISIILENKRNLCLK